MVEGIGWLQGAGEVGQAARHGAEARVDRTHQERLRVWVEVGVPVARPFRLLARVLALLATAPRSVLLGGRDSWLSTSSAMRKPRGCS